MLTRLRISEMNDELLGFSEMATINIGELMEKPRNVRIQQLMAKNQRAKEREVGDARKKEVEAKQQERRERVDRANRLAFDAVLPVVSSWAAGEGSPSDLKRFGRKQELQLLVMTPAEMKRQLSALQWQQLMTSGLQRPEVRAIAHHLKQDGLPSQAVPFVDKVKSRVAEYGEPTPEELGPSPTADGAPPPTGTRHISLKATWQLDGKQCTDAMSHLVTLCKGRHLALVDELLDLPSFSMSLGTLTLSVCDSEARSLDTTPSFTPCPRSRHALLHITGA